MSKIDIDNIRPYLQNYVNSITEPSKGRNMYVCPLCGSGTGKSRTGAFGIYEGGLKWKCQACGKGGDVFDLIGEYEHITEFTDRVNRLGEVLGVNIETDTKQNGKIINALAKMGGKKPEKDAFANTAIYSADGVQLFMEEFDKVKRGLSINAHKLLILAMNEFNKINNFEVTPDKGKLSLNNLRLGVHFSFTYYAELRGYDLSNKEQIKELRKSVNRDLTILKKSASLRWEENIKGKNVNFDDMSFFGRVYLKGDVIYMELTQSFGLYLKMLTLTQYSPGLMLIDGRSPNAYAIGVKMCEHYNMDNNVFKGTYNILRVETLLKETNLPTYEKILSQRGSWEAKIKEPFETALDTLTQVGVLSSWAYAGKRGKVLSDAEGYNITNYHEWADLRIKFELKNPKDQTERLERKAHEKKKSEARKARANKKKN